MFFCFFLEDFYHFLCRLDVASRGELEAVFNGLVAYILLGTFDGLAEKFLDVFFEFVCKFLFSHVFIPIFLF